MLGKYHKSKIKITRQKRGKVMDEYYLIYYFIKQRTYSSLFFVIIKCLSPNFCKLDINDINKIDFLDIFVFNRVEPDLSISLHS